MSARDRDDFQSLLGGASVEISARDAEAEGFCRELLDPGTTVYVNFGPRDTYQGVAAAARRLRRAGFNPVPHVAVRYLAGITQLDDYLARAAGEAGVEQILAIGGDIDRPAGPFHSSLQMLMTGAVERNGIRRVGIAGYPEPHQRISAAVLDNTLRVKEALLRQQGIEAYIVTQFCFEAWPVIAWIDRLRAQGVTAPVRVGLAGPASVATLAQFAVRCGIGHSIRALARGHTSIARLLVEVGPDAVVRDLVAARAPASGIEGLHFFTFGGIARTARWLRDARAEEFTPRLRGFG